MAANLPRTVCVKAGPIVIDGGNGTWCISITGDTGDLIPGGNGTAGPHNHPTSDIIGLDGKLSVLTQADLDINANLAGKANKTHSHPTSDILGLDGTLANITAGKANITHNHTASDITGLDIYIPKPTTPTTANQVLTYDGANWVAADTISAYVLPVANLTTLGGVKQGANVSIDSTGLLSVNLPAAANLTGYIQKPATATANQILTYNGTLWNAANAPTTGLTQSQADLLYQPLGGGMQTLTDAATVAWPLDPAKLASLTLGGTRTLSNPTNKAAGGVYLLVVKQNTTGGFGLNFGTEYKFPSGIKPIIPTSANSVTILTFVSDGVNMYGLQQGDFK